MTPEQMRHVAAIGRAFEERVHAKYAAGALEHGGNLWDQTPLQLADNAIDECVDQFTFLWTLREKLVASQAAGVREPERAGCDTGEEPLRQSKSEENSR